MKRVALTLCMVFFFSSNAEATLFFGWADEFVSATVDCKQATGQAALCTMEHQYVQLRAFHPPTWEHIGHQASNAGGRANAREKIMFRFIDGSVSGPGCFSATVNLARFRTTTPPVPGTTCNIAGPTFVGSSSQTFDSCQFALADTYINQRLLPTMNFSAETAVAATIGYQSQVTMSIAGGGSISVTGCYRVKWD